MSPAPVWVRARPLPAFYLMWVATPHLLSVIQVVLLTLKMILRTLAPIFCWGTYQDTIEAAIRAIEIPGTIIHIRGEHFIVFFITQVVTMLIIVDTIAVLRVTARPAHALHLR